MHALTAPHQITAADRLGVTVFFAVVAHLVVILGVTFVPRERPRNPVNTLDVVLVQHKTEKAPEKADYLAQATQDGGGESAEKARPATPVPAPFTSPQAVVAATAVVPAPPAPAPVEEPVAASPPPPPAVSEPQPAPKPVLAQKKVPTDLVVPVQPVKKPTPKSEPRQERTRAKEPERRKRKKRFVQSVPERKTETPAKPRAKPVPKTRTQPTRTLDAAALVNRTLAMASLSAEIDQKLKAYAERPRRKWISARTREHKYAAYMEAWRRKVERIGNLNYPDAARRRKLSGSLLLDVALNPNGSINEIRLRRSSGKRVLDDAAARIVKLAAPYSRFPKSITKETDILHIERTWVFQTNNHFASR